MGNLFRIKQLVFFIILFGLKGLLAFDCQAQNKPLQFSQKKIQAISIDVQPFINKFLPRVSKEFKQGELLSLISLFDYEVPDTNQLTQATNDLIRAKMDKATTDFGLDLRADYLQNLEQGIADIQSGGFYRRRGLISFKWDVLSNGLVEGNYKAKALKQQLRLNKMMQEAKTKDQAFSQLFNAIIFTFNKVKLKKLKNKRKILQKQVDIRKKLFKSDLLLWDKVLKSLSRKRETKNMLKSYKNYNEQVGEKKRPVNPQRLPVVDIKIDQVLEDIREKAMIDSMVKVKRKILDYQNHPVNDISLSPYLRYNIYNNPDLYVNDDGSTSAYRQFISFGVSFSAPIQFDWEERQKVKKAKLNQLRVRQKHQTENKVKEALNYYYEYQYALNQYIEFYHKRARILEKVRQEKTKKKINDGSYSPVRLLKLMGNLSSVNFETYDIHQKMYLKLLNIYNLVDEHTIRDIVKPINIKEQVGQLDTKRSLYIWSENFANTPNLALVKFLKQQNIQEVMLSLGPQDTVADKAKTFIPLAKDENIKTHIMIGNNRLFFSDRRHEIDEFLRSAVKLNAAGVHLDVEPHTLESWEANRETYLDKFIKMVKYTSKQASKKGLKLGVSIPLFYDKSIAQKIYPYCDKVFIMAYKQKDLTYLENKLMKELKIKQDKTVIALRPEDFKNLKAFNNFINQLKHRTRVNEFALHDLGKLEKIYKTGSD